MLYRVRHSHDHYIESQAEVEHHSITGDWEGYMGRHLGIDFHRSQITRETMMLYLALWVRINGIHNCLNCSSFRFTYVVPQIIYIHKPK